VGLEVLDKGTGVDAAQFGIAAVFALDSHSYPRDALRHQLFHDVGPQNPGRDEDIEGPVLVVFRE